jgi:hypothetical protein
VGTTYEALFTPVDHDEWKNGFTVRLNSIGRYFTANDLLEWLRDGTEPNKVQQISSLRREQWRHTVGYTKYLTDPNLDLLEAAKLALPGLFPGGNKFKNLKKNGKTDQDILTKALQIVQEDANEALVRAERWKSEGSDSNWGFESLKGQGVLLLDLDAGESESLVMPQVNTVEPYAEENELGPRKYKLEWEQHFTTQEEDDLKEKGKKVMPFRDENEKKSWAQIVAEV